MKCPVCNFNAPINSWISVNENPTKTRVAPRINYFTLPNSQQYQNIYVCPKCGTLHMRRPFDKN